jgi:glycosyltransferase involved in cell wall biosynthesis
MSDGHVSNKKKIAILGTRGIPARYGGFETFAEKLSVGLAERGFDVTVFCESGTTSAPSTFHGVNLRYVAAPSVGSLQTILYDARCLWEARSGYDVTYMLGYGAAPFCVIPRIWKTEVWINPDGLEWARSKWGRVARTYFKMMEWATVRVASRIIADAEAIAASISSRHGKLKACSVIPYGCEVIENIPPVKPLLEWELKPRDYYLVVCRLEPENHVREILEAFQRSKSERQLIVLGNHLSETSYVKQLRAIRDPRIRLIGTVYDSAKLISLRYHCFAYLHGHSVGGTNPSLLEAMGCSNLVFAHDNPFNRETLGECGIYFQDARELTQAIDRAEQKEGDIEPLREAARSRARDHYQWRTIIDKYAAMLERL